MYDFRQWIIDAIEFLRGSFGLVDFSDQAILSIAVLSLSVMTLALGIITWAFRSEATPMPRQVLEPELRDALVELNESLSTQPTESDMDEALDELGGLMSRKLNFDAMGPLALRGLLDDLDAPAANDDSGANDDSANGALKDRLLAELRADLAADKLVLPPLPESALELRRVITDPASTSSTIAHALEKDPALGARVLKIVNSARFAGYERVADLPTAVSRLGQSAVSDIVIAAFVGQVFRKSSSPVVDQHLKRLWAHSGEVAALAEQLARRVPHLKPQEALLAGLIHEIGAVPILLRLENEPMLLNDSAALSSVLETLAPVVGKAMLESWNFPPELVQVVAEYDQLERDGGDRADYADVVLVAKLVALVGQEQWQRREQPAAIPALAKLGLSLEETYSRLNANGAEIIEMRNGLG